jgi:hypothetical protein
MNVNFINQDTIDSIQILTSTINTSLNNTIFTKFDDLIPVLTNFIDIAQLELLAYRMIADDMTVEQREEFERLFAIKKNIDYSE